MTCRVCEAAKYERGANWTVRQLFSSARRYKKGQFPLYSRAHSINTTESPIPTVRASRKVKRILFPPQFRQADSSYSHAGLRIVSRHYSKPRVFL